MNRQMALTVKKINWVGGDSLRRLKWQWRRKSYPRRRQKVYQSETQQQDAFPR